MKSFTPFIIIAICIGMYFMYMAPTYADVQTLTAKKTQYNDALEKSKELTSQRDALIASYNSISPDDIARLDKVVPARVDAVLLATDLNTLATRYGLVFKNFKVVQTSSDDRSDVISHPANQPYQVTSATFDIKGPYEFFLKFISDLESSLRLIDVTNVSVKADNSPGIKSVSNDLQYSLGIRTYSLK